MQPVERTASTQIACPPKLRSNETGFTNKSVKRHCALPAGRRVGPKLGCLVAAWPAIITKSAVHGSCRIPGCMLQSAATPDFRSAAWVTVPSILCGLAKLRRSSLLAWHRDRHSKIWPVLRSQTHSLGTRDLHVTHGHQPLRSLRSDIYGVSAICRRDRPRFKLGKD